MKKKSKESIEKRSVCPIASTLDLVGDKWSLIIIRDMMYLGKTTYNEFLNSKEGISTNILNDRLIMLSEVGLITYTGTAKRKKYALTKRGLDLKSVLEAVASFGLKDFRGDKEELKKIKKVLNL
jgi:DNA-binding HxlR family transcriptional regulator